MTCDNPNLRKCDECGSVVDSWCEYEFGDVCLDCDANEAGKPESPTRAEQERQADERDAEALVRFFRAVLPKRVTKKRRK